jgi:hypothetical protein
VNSVTDFSNAARSCAGAGETSPREIQTAVKAMFGRKILIWFEGTVLGGSMAKLL